MIISNFYPSPLGEKGGFFRVKIKVKGYGYFHYSQRTSFYNFFHNRFELTGGNNLPSSVMYC